LDVLAGLGHGIYELEDGCDEAEDVSHEGREEVL
jgi:hypothetical protein